MADVNDIFIDDDFLRDVVNTPKEGTDQYKKRKELKSLIDRRKRHLLWKWTHERVDKESDEPISKKYVEYKQREIIKKR